MVRGIDIAPTLLHLAFVDAIEGMDGNSLVPRPHNRVRHRHCANFASPGLC
ncbi:MAG: hypothetical protein OXE82_05095 [Rhodobacter sp.]|nr:hypothetical protein [Rhodobacter sp.]